MFTFDSATRGKCWPLLHERVALLAARQFYALQCKQMPNGNAFCAFVRAARDSKTHVDIAFIHTSLARSLGFFVLLSFQDPSDSLAGLRCSLG